jgi:hypothetical protein
MLAYTSYLAGHFTHNALARVPWAAVMQEGQTWFELGLWMGDIMDPLKLKEKEGRALYNYWLRRQKQKKIAFQFAKANNRNVRVDGINKNHCARKATWITDESSSEEDGSNTSDDETQANEDEDEASVPPPGKKRKRADDAEDVHDVPRPTVKKKVVTPQTGEKLLAKGKPKPRRSPGMRWSLRRIGLSLGLIMIQFHCSPPLLTGMHQLDPADQPPLLTRLLKLDPAKTHCPKCCMYSRPRKMNVPQVPGSQPGVMFQGNRARRKHKHLAGSHSSLCLFSLRTKAVSVVVTRSKQQKQGGAVTKQNGGSKKQK